MFSYSATIRADDSMTTKQRVILNCMCIPNARFTPQEVQQAINFFRREFAYKLNLGPEDYPCCPQVAYTLEGATLQFGPLAQSSIAKPL